MASSNMNDVDNLAEKVENIALHDEYQVDYEPSIALKEPIDLNELRKEDGEGTMFEIKEEDVYGFNNENEEEHDYFSKEDVYEYLSKEAIGLDGEDDPDMDHLSPFERLARKMDDISPDLDGGVLKQRLSAGSGEVIPPEAYARVDYNGFLEYKEEPYDSSYLRKQGQRFKLGEGEVLPGYEIAIRSMRKGEVSRFLIKPEYMFGKMGCPPRVPGNATLMFLIELLDFHENAGVEDFQSLSRAQRREVPYHDVKLMCIAEGNQAKKSFAENSVYGYRSALRRYRRIIGFIDDVHLRDEEEEVDQQRQLVRWLTNAAAVNNKLKQPGQTIHFCNRGLAITMNDAKLHYLRGKAYFYLNDTKRSKSDLVRAKNLAPNDTAISGALADLDEKMRNDFIKEVEMARNMLNFSNTEENNTNNATAAPPSGASANYPQVGQSEISDAFRSIIRERLQEFKESDDLEKPFPKARFTREEIACLADTAIELGLEPKIVQVDDSVDVRVFKKQLP